MSDAALYVPATVAVAAPERRGDLCDVRRSDSSDKAESFSATVDENMAIDARLRDRAAQHGLSPEALRIWA